MIITADELRFGHRNSVKAGEPCVAEGNCDTIADEEENRVTALKANDRIAWFIVHRKTILPWTGCYERQECDTELKRLQSQPGASKNEYQIRRCQIKETP